MKILIACEESQTVCKAFRNKGHVAFSCDIQDCSGGFPEWHIKSDVVPLLNGNVEFITQDKKLHKINGKWDLIIAHPPCTYLTGAGAANIPKHPERIALGILASEFFEKFLNADCDKICVENPPPMKRFNLPHYSQLVRPYMFGERNNKPVALWLKNLPPLFATELVEKDNDLIIWYDKSGKRKSCSRWYNTDNAHHSKHRSKTFKGIAAAMAQQWGGG